jgi:uncharacterized membrane protein
MVNRALDAQNATHGRRATVERNGLLGAAGFITGEALMGIVLAVPIAIFEDANVLDMSPQTFVALALVAFTLVLMYRLAFAKDDGEK